MTSNFTKSFNSKSKEAKRYPITTLMDFWRFTLQDWFSKWIKFAQIIRYSHFIDSSPTQSVCVIWPRWWSQPTYKDLYTKTCTCNVFDLMGIPCVRALAATRSHVDLYTLCYMFKHYVWFWNNCNFFFICFKLLLTSYICVLV